MKIKLLLLLLLSSLTYSLQNITIAIKGGRVRFSRPCTFMSILHSAIYSGHLSGFQV
jgi:hypothetical protein